MNLQKEKLGLIDWISELNDSIMIEKLKSIHEEYSKINNQQNSLTTDDKESIERGLKDIEDGNIHSHETAKQIYEKYL